MKYKLNKNFKDYGGFTIIEIAIVLMVVTILLGYTLAMFPMQQELKQYREAEAEMEQVLNAIVGFAQVNGRLPCPAYPNSSGLEETTLNGCGAYTGKAVGDGKPWLGFVPVNTIGISGKLNQDNLLIDPWGNPYRYYVTDSDYFEDGDSDNVLDDDADTDPDGDGLSDFVVNGEMSDIGLADNAIDEENDGDDDIDADGYIDLDPNLIICDRASANSDRCNSAAQQVIGDVDTAIAAPATGDYNGFTYSAYAGLPVVLLSMGKNWAETATGDELENKGVLQSLTNLAIANGPTGDQYLFDNDSVYVKRTTGKADDFDDIIKWVSPNLLYSKMIEAGQLP